jgi:hypothetical protein
MSVSLPVTADTTVYEASEPSEEDPLMTTATDANRGGDHGAIPFVAWVCGSRTGRICRRNVGLEYRWSEEELLRYLEVLADTEQIHWGHYSLFLVAEVDGVPAAGMCGFFENEYGAASLMAGRRR